MSQYLVRKQFGVAGQSVWPGQIIGDESIGDAADELGRAGYIEKIEEEGTANLSPGAQAALIPEDSAPSSGTDDPKGKKKAS